MTDQLPDGLTYQSSTSTAGSSGPSAGSITVAGNLVTDTLGDVGANGSDTLTITVTPTTTGSVSDQAAVTASNVNSGTAVNSNSLSTTVVAAVGATYFNGQGGDNTAATFVENLYRELLGREPDSAGQAFWVSLDTNLSASGTVASAQQTIVTSFLASPEYGQHLVTAMYGDLLHRAPEAAGLQFWAGAVAAGADEKQVLAGILGSDEYYAAAGQSASGFVSALYHDVLGRNPDSGSSFWTNLFTSAPSFLPPIAELRDFRVALAEVFLSTPEADHKLLNGNFPAAAGNVGAPGTPAVGAFALADLTGDGWDNLYFQGSLSAANVDALFAQLQSGAAYDETIADMLEMQGYFDS